MDRILIIGAARGGTSLFNACLDGHPDITMRAELGRRLLLGDEGHCRRVDTILQDRLENFYRFCQRDWEGAQGHIWGNKITTEQILGLEDHNIFRAEKVDTLLAFASCMKDFKILFITRDGRACVDSKTKRTGQTLQKAAMRWMYCVHAHRRLSALGALSITIRYEDLVRAPRETLSKVCHVIGVDFHEDMLSQTDSTLMRPAYRYGAFIPEKAENIPELPDKVLNMIRDGLIEFGYLSGP